MFVNACNADANSVVVNLNSHRNLTKLSKLSFKFPEGIGMVNRTI